LAYLLSPKWVMRAGYGIFFDSIGADRVDVSQQGFSQKTSLTPSLDNGLTFRGTLQNPFPDGLQEPLGASAGLKTFLGRAPAFFDPSRRAGYNQRWSFGLQRELGSRTVVEAAYVGSKAVGLGITQESNPVPAKYQSTLQVRDQARNDYLQAAVPNPFAAIPDFAGSNLVGKTTTVAQLLRPYPQFTGISSVVDGGFSWYHSLQTRVEKRFSHGFTIQGSYTWSKFMEAMEKLNPTDPVPTHSIAGSDRPHHLVISGIYELPIGRGKALASNANRWENHLIGGWSLQAIYQAQSGPPIGFGNIFFYGNLQDLVLPKSERTVERWFNTAAGFETDSKKQPVSNIRTFPLRLTGLRAPGYNSWDISVFKTVQLREGIKLQIRGEAQDAMNHTTFDPPNTNPSNSLFGQITTVSAAEQRRITLGCRVSW
jgi:hypothetical protein